MILRELYYFDEKTMEPVENDRYEPADDKSIIQVDDKRKSKLTLKDINKARKASDMHKEDAAKELNFIRQMYGLASQAAMAG
jgi:DNA-binding XRE family transcriptional regulator